MVSFFSSENIVLPLFKILPVQAFGSLAKGKGEFLEEDDRIGHIF